MPSRSACRKRAGKATAQNAASAKCYGAENYCLLRCWSQPRRSEWSRQLGNRRDPSLSRWRVQQEEVLVPQHVSSATGGSNRAGHASTGMTELKQRGPLLAVTCGPLVQAARFNCPRGCNDHRMGRPMGAESAPAQLKSMKQACTTSAQGSNAAIADVLSTCRMVVFYCAIKEAHLLPCHTSSAGYTSPDRFVCERLQ